MKPPGLISREIIDDGGEMVHIREVWDPRVEGCPLLVFRSYTWPMEIQKDVAEVVHTYPCPRHMAIASVERHSP